MTLENTPIEYTEQHLIFALLEGKPEAISLIYDKYAAVLLGLITRMVRNSEVAEAVLQDTFLAIWHQKSAYNGSRLRLLSWLILIARDTALAALRSGKYTPAMNGSPANGVGNNNSTTGSETMLSRNVDCLTVTDKVVLDLIFLQGRTWAETAEEMNIPIETVKTIFRTACQHLRTGKAL